MLDNTRAFQESSLIRITFEELAVAIWHDIGQVTIKLHHLARSIEHVCLVIVIEEERCIMEVTHTAVDGPLALDVIGSANIGLSSW